MLLLLLLSALRPLLPFNMLPADMKVANLLDEEIPQIYALTGRCVTAHSSSSSRRWCATC
jgi:hypothetical protein